MLLDIQSQWGSFPPIIKWLLGLIGSIASAAVGVYVKATYHAATNCLPTIQKNTSETNALLRTMLEQDAYRRGHDDGKKES